MKVKMDRGKLIEPKSLVVGLQRQKQLIFETKRIENQINDRYREDSFASKAEYATWRASAERALKLFQTELRLLTEWIDVRQQNAERLLREAYEVLKTLEIEVDFKPHETTLIEQLDDYFERKEPSAAPTGNQSATNARLTT